MSIEYIFGWSAFLIFIPLGYWLYLKMDEAVNGKAD